MRRRRTGRRTLIGSVASLALAAALATVSLSGCSSGGDDQAAAPEPAGAAATAPARAPAGTPEARSSAPPGNGEERAAGTTARSTAPRGALEPATGSFTEKEKEYLTGRVPEGIDPAAVLDGGDEACQRIGRTAKVDREAAIDAIRTGEIGGAEEAIEHLCPEHTDLLRAAQG